MAISYEEFEKVDLRSGIIVKAEEFLRAKKWRDNSCHYGFFCSYW